ncbi:MAG: undecaprenyl-diphosphate phosphatase [bacterium]
MNPLVIPALLLGAVQGVTEFLPVSSTAHLIVVPAMTGWSDPLLNSLAFDVALHIGTLAALLAAFGSEWTPLLAALRRPNTTEGRFAWGIGLATLPALAAGKLFEHAVEGALRGPVSVACWLGLGGAALLWADKRRRGTRPAKTLTLREAALIGGAQALALLPGISRSGATITAGLLLGLSRREAARYSFLLSAPVIAAACAWKLRHFPALAPAERLPLLAGIVAAGVLGAIAIRLLLRLIARASYAPFAVYRFALAAILAVWRPIP